MRRATSFREKKGKSFCAENETSISNHSRASIIENSCRLLSRKPFAESVKYFLPSYEDDIAYLRFVVDSKICKNSKMESFATLVEKCACTNVLLCQMAFRANVR